MPVFHLHKKNILPLKLCASLLLTILIVGNAVAQKPLKFSTTVVNAPTIINNTIFKDKTSLKRSIKPFNKDILYTSKDKRIGFALILENTLREEQFGSIEMQISNSNGAALYKENHPFKIKKRGIYEKEYVFDANQMQPGFYVSSMKIVTDKYADTTSYNFGYDADKVYVKSNPPQNLVNFWQQALGELQATPANFNATPRPDLKNKNGDAYEIEFNSTDKAVIYGWLTVPKSGKNIPVLYKISDYKSELGIEFRRDVAVLCINTRGTGSSTANYNYGYNDLGLVNLNDKNKYVLKGIFLDALRGLDFIKSFAGKLNLNTSKMVVTGNGLGASASAIVAALNPNLKGIILDSPSFLDLRSTINFGEGMTFSTFPASMYKNYYAGQKNNKETMLSTLDYFDAVHFAPYINCPVLMGLGLKNVNTPAQSGYNFLNQLRVQKIEKYICKQCDATLDKGFYGLKETWLKEKFGQP